MVDVLLARGADPNIRDNGLRTGEMPDGDNAMPLHFAAEQGHLGIVRRLVEHGADPTRRNAQGLTAADIADKRGLDAVARLLRSHGGERLEPDRIACGRASRECGSYLPATRRPRPIRKELDMRRHILFLCPLLVACSNLGEPDAASGRDPEPLPLIRVQGNRLVDDMGASVVLRGVSFSDPDRLDKAGQWNRAYFQAAVDWNANLVRFPVHPPAWRERGVEAYLHLLDQGVEWASELGMYVIIDWHSIGNLVTEQFFRPPMYNTTRTETLHFWEIIARRYAGNPTVAFYELFNEPTDFNEALGRLTWPEHRGVMEEIISVIREHNPDAIPLVGGLDFGYDLSGVSEEPVRRPGVAYVSHPYPQKREPPWEEAWQRDFGFVADTYPILATEFGFMSEDGPGAHVPVIGDETYGDAIVGFFESKGISWTAWVFDPVWSPQLIENWEYEPTRQGRFFRDKLTTLNPER